VRDDRPGQRRQQVALDRARQRARAHVDREAAVEEEVDGALVDLDRPLAARQTATLEHRVDLAADDAAHHVARERAEHHDAVKPVHELRPQRVPHGARDALLGEPARCGRALAEPERLT
jgi:hypothetical protein